MVVDTSYYELLQIKSDATSLEIKKAYRKQAIRLHPDKNPDDPQAAAKFQEVGQAYQVLSDEKLRERYDKYGKEESIPSEGFEDPAEFFSMIFGGEAFKDWIGELSLLSELTKSAELNEEPNEEADKKLISDKTHDDEAQRKEKIEKFEEECRVKKIESRKELSEKLINKLSLFTETDMKEDVVKSFKSKIAYEAESLKMESFGLEILHTIGQIYKLKSKIFLKNQTFFGWGGIWWSVKEKGGVVKDTFRTVSAALDAQKTMEEYTKMQQDNEYHVKKEEEEKAKAEEEVTKLEEQLNNIQREKEQANQESSERKNENGNGTENEVKEPEKHTAEDLAEMEKFLLAKVLAAAWNGSKFEIQGTVRSVCDSILEDEDASIETRAARAKALRLIGEVFSSVSRTEAEDEEARIFEELVAEASKKREKKKKPETENK